MALMNRGRRRRILLAPLILAAIFIAFQYFSAETFVNPETGEKVRVALSEDQEDALGLQSFQQVLSQSKVISSGPQYEMTMRVAEKIIGVVDKGSSDFNWNVKVIESPEINAFCLPGGKIAVYTGIIPVAQNDDGLAAVIGHEIAHATARHGAQRVFQQSLVQTGLLGVQGALSDLDYDQQRILLGALGAGVQFGIVLPYSREHEFEADKIGLIYMIRAGYDPNEAARFWQRMSERATQRNIEWASTHPGHESRIQRINELIPQLIAEHKRVSSE